MKDYLRRLPYLLLALMLIASCKGKGESDSPHANCAEDLKGYSVGCMTGSLVDLQFEKIAPGAKKQIFNTESDVFAALESRKVDFAMIDSIFVIGIDKKEHPIETSYSEMSLSGDVGVAFRKTDAALCGQFNEFLARIKADGTYSEMKARWISDNYNNAEMPEIETFNEGKALEVGMLIEVPLCFSRNSEWTGFEIELMKRFAAYLHRPFKPEFYEFSSLMAGLKTGVIDVWCSFVTINEERAREVLFSDPYLFSAVSVFQRPAANAKTDPFHIRVCRSFNNNLIVENRWKMLVDGLWETLVIAFFSLIFGTILGGLVCLLRMSRNRFASGFARVYIEILRGVPMLVLLMVMFYVVLSSTGISGRWVAIISFAINFSAYVSEIFRTGICSVEKGQTEAGLAMGFTRVGTFFNFVLPQALNNILPVFKNEAISLLKGTSIVGYVAIHDLTKASDIIRARTFDAFFPLIIISIVYFLLAWLFGKALDLLDKKSTGI